MDLNTPYTTLHLLSGSLQGLPKQRSLKEFGILRPASSDQDLTAPSAKASEKRKYGVRGTCGTFAGKRPPKDEGKLKIDDAASPKFCLWGRGNYGQFSGGPFTAIELFH